MSEKVLRKQIGERIFFSTVQDEKFKLSKISINLIAPLKRETATANALVSNLFSNGCSRFPTQTALNRKLGMMYGCILESDIKKSGDSQIISLNGVCIDDSFTINGEKLLLELSALLCEVLLDPPFENSLFSEKNVSLEKEVLKDTILSEINDKRYYAVNQAIKKICPDDPFSISNYGYVEDLDTLTPKKVTERYRELISESAIEIVCAGKSFDTQIEDLFKNAFSKITRKGNYTYTANAVKLSQITQEFVETMDVEQSKLVLGFKSTSPITPQLYPAASVMTTLYGGSAYSKLFMNVREKMSLCYYASSSLDKRKNILIADSAVEHAHIEKAKNAIIEQLDDIKNNVFTNDELENAKKTLITACNSVIDSPGGLESWYLTGFVTNRNLSPKEEAQNIKNVTRQDVVKVANLFKLDTVYVLTGGGEDE